MDFYACTHTFFFSPPSSLRKTLMVQATRPDWSARRWRAVPPPHLLRRPLRLPRPRPLTRPRRRSASPSGCSRWTRRRRRWKINSRKPTASSRRPSPERASAARRTSRVSWVLRVSPARPSCTSAERDPRNPRWRRAAKAPESSLPEKSRRVWSSKSFPSFSSSSLFSSS